MKVSGLLALVVALMSYIVWQKKQAEARVRLRELDEGRRCIACDGTQMETSGGAARCLRCGHQVSLEALQAAKISESEIAAVTRPPEDRRW
jgi:hypothetical protein